MTLDPATALAAYGTLAPGEVNHHVLSNIAGRWLDGTVLGYQFEITWGDAEGYDGFFPDRSGHRVPVSILVSDQLDRHWGRIDRFEGRGYDRRPIEVLERDGETVIGEASIYVCLTDNE